MTVSTERWEPHHDTVVLKLHDNLKKLGIKEVDYASGIPVSIGPNVRGKMDLVVIKGYRTRGNRRGRALALFEVKTAGSGLFRVVWEFVQQLDMYSIALENPDLFAAKEGDREKLSEVYSNTESIIGTGERAFG